MQDILYMLAGALVVTICCAGGLVQDTIDREPLYKGKTIFVLACLGYNTGLLLYWYLAQ